MRLTKEEIEKIYFEHGKHSMVKSEIRREELKRQRGMLNHTRGKNQTVIFNVKNNHNERFS